MPGLFGPENFTGVIGSVAVDLAENPADAPLFVITHLSSLARPSFCLAKVLVGLLIRAVFRRRYLFCKGSNSG
jgi:hypothetical protein